MKDKRGTLKISKVPHRESYSELKKILKVPVIPGANPWDNSVQSDSCPMGPNMISLSHGPGALAGRPDFNKPGGLSVSAPVWPVRLVMDPLWGCEFPRVKCTIFV